jgi:hypothetical protein
MTTRNGEGSQMKKTKDEGVPGCGDAINSSSFSDMWGQITRSCPQSTSSDPIVYVHPQNK